MNDLNELQQLWQSADTARVPAYKEMMQAIAHYRRNNLLKKSAIIAIAILLTCILVSVVFLYKSVMVTTRIGEAFMIMAGLLLVVTNLRSIGRLYRVKDHTNKEFADYLQQVQVNRLYYYKRTQVLGLSLASVGLCFYVYEAVHSNLLWCAIAYGFLICYFAFVWLVIRPRAYRRQAAKLDKTIKKIESLTKQF